ncbi:hypothetical protein BC6_00025 [Bacillus phage BC-6]|nr:hypothetical protein BC6_00025 [Bacillus phage BC-6]
MKYTDVKVGMKVVVLIGKHKGKEATINDISGCIFAVLENGLEIEVHEDWIIEVEVPVKFYSSEASKGAKRKLVSYRGGVAVADRGGYVFVKPYKDGYIRAVGDRRYH